MFLETFKGDSRSSKGVSRQFQRRIREAPRLYKESVKFASKISKKKFQGCSEMFQ